ncbi:Dpy-30 motif protein [Cardiosporidium cionae]|uniref:Dpy-30 motif protein n=1 Tax=Cardiosporidium cionae TaxID=476202 RepID=A0ABQ7J988_9APIC|nr:Dpy-30 motif protein [Cardiosporidium cionae]|eukprot:KAF8820547.1 Dpy-30 motif protein [Cardiosporidium cionae]
MRIFIDCASSYLGTSLCKELNLVGVKPPFQQNRLFGTLAKTSVTPADDIFKALKPNELWRVVESWPVKKKLKTILSCSLIVFDLHSSDFADVENVLRALKETHLSEPTVLVLISSVMVWARTPNSYQREISSKIENDFGKTATSSTDNQEDPTNLSQNSILVADVSYKNKTQSQSYEYSTSDQYQFLESSERLPLSSKDYKKRLPYPKYERWKYLETLCMSLGKVENLKTYVIGAGILYGNGEDVFYPLFKTAWLSEKTSHVIGPGTNVIPMVHVTDVARLVGVLSSGLVEEQYHLAIDMANSTQLSIVQGVIDGIGEHYEVPMVLSEHVLLEKNADLFTVDLVMHSTEIMLNSDFNWHCKNGLIANLSAVTKEFCEKRNLQPIQICILGELSKQDRGNRPPGAGKTRIAELLSSQYGIEHIQVEQFIRNFNGNKAQFIKEQILSRRTIFPNSIKNDTQIKRDDKTTSSQHKMTDSICDLVRKKLCTSNACRLRGYVLDGFPRSYEEAENLYSIKHSQTPTQENMSEPEFSDSNGDEERDSFYTTQLENYFPQFVFTLNTSDNVCKKRSMRILAKELIVGYNDEEGFLKRMSLYKQANSLENNRKEVATFFRENTIEILNISPNGLKDEDLLSSLRIYIEKDGRPFNFLKTNAEIIQEREEQMREQEILERQKEEKERHTRLEEENANKLLRQQEETERLNMINEHELALLESRSLPLREYLMKYVIPTLSEGLVTVCKVQPEDPIDFLADYLFEHAHDSPNE